MRNNPPGNGTEPAFVAWPLNDDHVVKLVKFFGEHDMCISVSGTGHDYMNRHMSIGC